MEEWRDIEGYEGLYKVSNLGRVKSLGNDKSRKEKILRPCKNRNGYLYVNLCKGGNRKRYYIHRLVLITFSPCDNMENLEVNHLDENKENNMLENLEWCTRSYNLAYNDMHKRVGEKNSIKIVQLSLDGKYIRSYKSSHDAEREKGFHQGNIIQCCKGKFKSHGGYRWCYLYDYISKIDPRIKKIILFDKEYMVN